jgi:hypothetical protein
LESLALRIALEFPGMELLMLGISLYGISWNCPLTLGMELLMLSNFSGISWNHSLTLALAACCHELLCRRDGWTFQ